MEVKFLCEPLFLPTSSYSSVLLSVKGKQKLPPPRWIRPTRSTGASGAHWSEKFPSTAQRIEQTSSDQTTERRPSLPRNCPFFMHLQSETLQTHTHSHAHTFIPPITAALTASIRKWMDISKMAHWLETGRIYPFSAFKICSPLTSCIHSKRPYIVP